MDLDGWRLVYSQHLVAIEVGLLDAAVLQGDLAMERRRDAENDRALDLRLDGVGIDDGTAINCADDAPYPHRSVLRHLNLGDVSHIGREYVLKRDASADSFRRWLAPAGFFRRKGKNGFRARRFAKESKPIGDWVLL